MKLLIKSLTLLGIFITLFYSCKTSKQVDNNEEHSSYDWEEIQVLINKGLVKQAEVKLNEIIQDGLANHRELDALNAFAILSRFLEPKEGEFEEKVIISTLTFSEKLSDPAALALSHLILANNFYHYWRNNQWNLPVDYEGMVPEDTNLKEWSSKQFVDTINVHYLKALDFASKSNISVNALAQFFTNSKDVAHLSLYEYVLVDWIKTIENPIYVNRFDLDNVNCISCEKIAEPFLENDAPEVNQYLSELMAKYRLLFDSLKKEGKIDLWVKFETRKINYLKSINILNEQSYVLVINNLKEAFEDFSYVADFEKANFLINEANAEQNKKLQSDFRLEAVDLLNNIIELNIDSVYVSNSENLIDQLNQSKLDVSSEDTYLPKKPIIFKVDHYGVKELHYRIYQLSLEDYKENSRRDMLKFENKSIVQSSRITLPDPEFPYTIISSEFFLEGLETGFYGIEFSNGPEFQNEKSMVTFSATFLVTNLITHYYKKAGQSGTHVEVVNRSTGEKVSDFDAEIYQESYNSSSRKNEYQLQRDYKNVNSFVITRQQSNWSRLIPLIIKGDDFFMHKNGINDYQNVDDKMRTAGEILTDRSIYRPGQEVYFQAFIFSKTNNKYPEALSNRNGEIVFNDNFGQKITAIQFTTDIAGSFNGSFKIPESIQNGAINYQVSLNNEYVQMSYSQITVAEYKRPKFEVEILENKDQYSLGDVVKVSAKANTLIGVPVSNAKVEYKIYRSGWRPYFPYYGRSIFPPFNNEKKLIQSGSSETDEDGLVNIEFEAVPDPVLNIKSFNYEVEVSVTDISGETQIVNQNYRISDRKVFLSLVQNANSQDSVTLKASNNSGTPVNTAVRVKIFKYYTDEYKIDRLWEYPDTLINEDLVNNDYTKLLGAIYPELVLDETYEVNGQYTINLLNLLEGGSYKIILSNPEADSFEQIIDLNDFSKNEFGITDLFHLSDKSVTKETGDKLSFSIGSNVNDLPIHILKIRNNQVVEENWVKINGTHQITETISEVDKGGYTYDIIAFYKNRFYQQKVKVHIPWTEKQLTIKPITTREITNPGSEEKWSFQVLDKNGQPVEASFTATMYDAALDQIQNHDWQFDIMPSDYSNYYLDQYSYGQLYYRPGNYQWNNVNYSLKPTLVIPQLSFAWQYGSSHYIRGEMVMKSSATPPAPPAMEAEEGMMSDNAMAGNNVLKDEEISSENNELNKNGSDNVRTNLKESVFFFPALKTDEKGMIEIDFTMNEALTTWKNLNFAYTKDLQYGKSDIQIITKKELMIQANQVRFLRMNDNIDLSAKVFNLSEESISAKVDLLLYDGVTDENIPFRQTREIKRLILDKGGVAEVNWNLSVPEDVEFLKIVYRVESDQHTDAEQHIIPVVPDKVFLISSEAVLLNGLSNASVNLDSLFEGNKAPQRLVVESTGSPVWYAIQSLPFLMEKEHENAEIIFNRYFANSLALKLMNDNPLIKTYFDQWKALDNLKSSLTKNEELKNVKLSQTPWMKNALSEEDQMKLLAEVMTNPSLHQDQSYLIQKLAQLQLSNGGFPWFAGGRDNYYISLIILEGIQRMKSMNLISEMSDDLIRIEENLFTYCQERAVEWYKKFNYKKADMVSSRLIQMLFIDSKIDKRLSRTVAFISMKDKLISLIEDNWYEYALDQQIYLAWILEAENNAVYTELLQSIKERSVYNDKLGRYWVSYGNSWSCQNIEQQSRLIELFDHADIDAEMIDEMKFWLINNKRTNSWESTIATSSAIYALTLGEYSTFKKGEPIVTHMDGNLIKADLTIPGIAYSKKSWEEIFEFNDNHQITFENKNENKAWANVHFQFYQKYVDVKRTNDDLLDIKKEMFLINSEDNLVPIETAKLEPGDKIMVRLLINSDREMEFVHIMDERPSGFEPTQNLSGYKWGGSISYYQSIKDMGTHFFIESISKGSFILEYEMIVNNKGQYTSGVAKVQNFYAPEFNDYSKAFNVKVD